MCGRAYSTFTDEELEMRYERKRPMTRHGKIVPNYNLSPTQYSPIIYIKEGQAQLELFKWGLIPFWSKDAKTAYKTFNARSETVDHPVHNIVDNVIS